MTHPKYSDPINGVKYILAVALFALLAIGAYALYFSVYLIGGPADWGQFGDYFSGIVNPVIGIVTVVLVVETLKATRAEADLTRQEMTAQTALFSSQLQRYERESHLSELQKRLDGALAAWNVAMEQEFPNLEGRLLGYAAPTRSNLRAMFARSTVETEVSAAMERDTWKFQAPNWDIVLDEPANILRELAIYCSDYDEAVGNRVLTDFYRRRVNMALRAMKMVGLVQPKTEAALSIGRLINP